MSKEAINQAKKTRLQIIAALFLLAAIFIAAILPESILPQTALARASQDRTCILSEDDYNTPLACSKEVWNWLRQNSAVFESLAAFHQGFMRLDNARGSPLKMVTEVSANFFVTIDAQFTQRGMVQAEDKNKPFIYVSEEFVRQELPGLTNVLGSRVSLDRKEYVIAGVLKETRSFPHDSDFWLVFPRETGEGRSTKTGQAMVGLVGKLNAKQSWRSAQRRIASELAVCNFDGRDYCRIVPVDFSRRTLEINEEAEKMLEPWSAKRQERLSEENRS